MARIYAASSWRNPHQPEIVRQLRSAGHEVYDFRAPFNGVPGFAWSEIDPGWQSWRAEEYRRMLTTHPIASRGFVSDLRAIQWADTCLLILPCLTRDGEEPELMALLATDICISMEEVLLTLAQASPCGRIREANANLPQRTSREGLPGSPFSEYEVEV